MKTIATLIISIGIFFYANAQEIIEEQSYVNFSAEYLGFGNVEGSFNSFSGEIDLDKNDIYNSSIAFSLNAESVQTKSKRRTRFIKGEDFFNAETFPTIDFKSTSITQVGQNYAVIGRLVAKGISKTIAIPFQLDDNGSSIYLTGDITLDRFDFNMGTKYKEWVIGRDVAIQIGCSVVANPHNTAA